MHNSTLLCGGRGGLGIGGEGKGQITKDEGQRTKEEARRVVEGLTVNGLIEIALAEPVARMRG
jgi:hypothetical protein